jgi:hypothetical protein
VLIGWGGNNVNIRPSIYAALTKEADLNLDLAMLGEGIWRVFIVPAGYVAKRETTA